MVCDLWQKSSALAGVEFNVANEGETFMNSLQFRIEQRHVRHYSHLQQSNWMNNRCVSAKHCWHSFQLLRILSTTEQSNYSNDKPARIFEGPKTIAQKDVRDNRVELTKRKCKIDSARQRDRMPWMLNHCRIEIVQKRPANWAATMQPSRQAKESTSNVYTRHTHIAQPLCTCDSAMLTATLCNFPESEKICEKINTIQPSLSISGVAAFVWLRHKQSEAV